MYTKVLNSIAVFATALALVAPLGAMAARPMATVPAQENNIVQASNDIQASALTTSELSVPLVNELIKGQKGKNGGGVQAAASPYVAYLTIFTDTTNNSSWTSGSGGLTNFGSHSWLKVTNVSANPITVGGLSGIAGGRSVTLGTWSSSATPEHHGLWYNLEQQRVYHGQFTNRISVTFGMSAADLNKLNSLIPNADFWTLSGNCSFFASNAWNMVVSSWGLPTLIPTTNPPTPVKLANDIKLKYNGYYQANVIVPWYYLVYIAHGRYAPTVSTTQNW